MYDSNTGKEIKLSEIDMIRFLAELTMKKNQSEELKDFEEESGNTQDEISGIEDQIENDREAADAAMKENQEKIILDSPVYWKVYTIDEVRQWKMKDYLLAT